VKNLLNMPLKMNVISAAFLLSYMSSPALALAIQEFVDELPNNSSGPDFDMEMATRIPRQPTLACAGANCKAGLEVTCDPTVGDGNCVKEVMPPTLLECGRHRGCASCVGDLHCGWCQTSGKCTEGYVANPKAGNCTDWDYAFCSGEACSVYGNCASCGKDPMCGWCDGKKGSKCTEGSSSGAVVEKCPVGTWQYDRCKKNGDTVETRVVNMNDPAQVKRALKAKAFADAGLDPY